jgi:hypothetical protein
VNSARDANRQLLRERKERALDITRRARDEYERAAERRLLTRRRREAERKRAAVALQARCRGNRARSNVHEQEARLLRVGKAQAWRLLERNANFLEAYFRDVEERLGRTNDEEDVDTEADACTTDSILPSLPMWDEEVETEQHLAPTPASPAPVLPAGPPEPEGLASPQQDTLPEAEPLPAAPSASTPRLPKAPPPLSGAKEDVAAFPLHMRPVHVMVRLKRSHLLAKEGAAVRGTDTTPAAAAGPPVAAPGVRNKPKVRNVYAL